MDFIRFPAELQLLIAEKLESRELSYLCRANHYFHSLCTPVLERLAQEPRGRHCALWWAIINNYPPLVQLLLSKGHDINHLGRDVYVATALHEAISCRNYPLIRLFLENPALDLNKLDRDGNTALHRAIEWGDPEVVKLLHTAGADLEIADRCGRTALLLALIVLYLQGHRGIMEYLVKNGANVNVRLSGGPGLDVTLLHCLVALNNGRLVRLVLEYGADPEVRDGGGSKAIDHAREWKFTSIVDILREMSLPLDIDVDSDLETMWGDALSG